MNILCTICARSDSKGLKNKNVKMINGIPLVAHSIIQAKKSRAFDKIVVSTDSKKIQKIARFYEAECWFLRPKYLASGTIAKLPVIKHLLLESEKKFNTKFDIIMDLDVTSPLRLIKDIKNSFKQFLKNKSINMVSVCKSHKNPYFNMIELKNNHYEKVKKFKNINFFTRQKSPVVYDMNASIYLWKRKALVKDYKIINKHTSIFIMPKKRSIDIDTKDDFDYVKFLMSK